MSNPIHSRYIHRGHADTFGLTYTEGLAGSQFSKDLTGATLLGQISDRNGNVAAEYALIPADQTTDTGRATATLDAASSAGLKDATYNYVLRATWPDGTTQVLEGQLLVGTEKRAEADDLAVWHGSVLVSSIESGS